MKVSDLFESKYDEPTVQARRMMKFSIKNGENSLGVDLAGGKFDYYAINNFVYIGKPNELKLGDAVRFENADKPGFQAIGNSKMGPGTFGKVNKIFNTVQDTIKYIKAVLRNSPIVIINAALTNGVKREEKKEEEELVDPDDGYFLLGYWGNPYPSRGDDEYYWAGPFRDKKKPLAMGKRKQEHGQPRTMRDWTGGGNRIIKGKDKFALAAKKAGLKPNLTDLYWMD